MACVTRLKKKFWETDLWVLADFERGFKRLLQQKDDIILVNLIFKKGYVIQNPAYVHEILVRNHHKCNKKNWTYYLLNKLLGKGLVTSSGDFWQKQRKLIQPMFHKRQLQEMFSTVLQHTSILNEVLSQDRYATSFGAIRKDLSTCLESTIFDLLIASGINNEKRQAVIDHVIYLFEWFKKRSQHVFPQLSYFKDKKAYKRHRASRTIVFELIEQRLSSGSKESDLLQMMMDVEDADTGEKMSKQQIFDELVTLYAAAQETTLNTLEFMFVAFQQHPEVKDNVYQEVNTVFQNGVIEVEALKDLVYTEAVIKEVMRLYPAVISIARDITEDIQLEDDVLPKGSDLIVPIINLHYHPDYWHKPNQFIPERFLDGQEKIEKGSYLPFSIGPRYCIGNAFSMMIIKGVISSVLMQFKLEFDPDFRLNTAMGLSMMLKDPIRIKCTKREEKS